jgi:hypothetical protein
MSSSEEAATDARVDELPLVKLSNLMAVLLLLLRRAIAAVLAGPSAPVGFTLHAAGIFARDHRAGYAPHDERAVAGDHDAALAAGAMQMEVGRHGQLGRVPVM